MTSANRLEDLEAEARYHRERLALYRARVYSGRPTTVLRMRELERLCEHAERRVRRLYATFEREEQDDRLESAESVRSGAS
jgi:hypothetical protein